MERRALLSISFYSSFLHLSFLFPFYLSLLIHISPFMSLFLSQFFLSLSFIQALFYLSLSPFFIFPLSPSLLPPLDSRARVNMVARELQKNRIWPALVSYEKVPTNETMVISSTSSLICQN